MKRLIFVLLFALSLNSCGDSNEEAEPITLAGRWEVQALTFEGEAAFEFEGIPLTGTVSGQGREISYTLDFSENPQTFTSSGSLLLAYTFVTFGQSIQDEERLSGEDLIAEGSWSQAEGLLTITDPDGNEAVIVIDELTESTAVLIAPIEQEVAIDEFETGVTMTGEATIVLSR